MTDGVLVVDKPHGITSHDVVAIARRVLGEKRIGHTGTLDPMATGVLPLAIGRATRLVRFLTATDKEYEATIRFGLTTNTYDITGTAVAVTAERPTRAAIDEALRRLTGEYLQMPPAYSAKKVGGTRAYALARRDETVELQAVPVRVSHAEVLEAAEDAVVVAVTCSAGFYVRSFAHELGRLVGTGACLAALRRTRSGEFSLHGAVTVEQLQRSDTASGTRPIDRLLAGFPAVYVDGEGRRRVAHGQEIEGPAAPWTRIIDAEGHLLAVAQPSERPGFLHPSVVLI
jgi:tRNA pseudouridine55 synthase